MQEFEHKDVKIAFETAGQKEQPVIFWTHGWGQDHKSFLPLVQSLEQTGRHILVDLPGFGISGTPNDPWGTKDYADAIAALIKSITAERIIWVGHSFGCRVGLQLAAHYPELIKGLFLIAAAGLPRKRPLLKKL